MSQAAGPHAHALAVTARDASGAQVAFFALAHGQDPVQELGRLGWAVEGLRAVEPAGERLVLVFSVHRGEERPVPEQPVPTDPGLVRREGEQAEAYQRTAAYGVVTSTRGLLLTELSETTSAPGRWTLPGGGLDAGETPEEALHREVWEESGQEITDVRLLDLHTSHWIGRAPSGRLEDFHAVRIVYAATCPAPTDPVVHDVGGSTASVRWVLPEELEGYYLSRSFAPHLRRWAWGVSG